MARHKKSKKSSKKGFLEHIASKKREKGMKKRGKRARK